MKSCISLNSCISHNMALRSLADSTSAESDSRAYQQRRSGTCQRRKGHRDRYCGRRLDSTSSSRRLVDSDLSSRPSNHSENCEFARSAVCDGTRSRSVRQPSSLWRDVGRRRSSWSISVARRRRAAAPRDVQHAPNHDDNDCDYITTSSESEDLPLTSTSSIAPPNCVDDRASSLSNSTTSSSVAFIVLPPRRPSYRSLRQQQPAESSPRCSSRHFFPCPRIQKSASSGDSLTTSDNFDNNAELKHSRSSVEVAISSCNSTEGSEAVISQSSEDELRAVKSLFEFRSSDQRRVANKFIDGVWSLYSRRSLYNERQIHIRASPLLSSLSEQYTGLKKDFQSYPSCDVGKIVATDDKNIKNISGNEQQRSLRTAQNTAGIVDNSSRRINVADIVACCDDQDTPYKSQKEFPALNMIAELTNVTATINEDDFTIYIRKSPTKLKSTPNGKQDTDVPTTERQVPLPKPGNTDCDMCPEDVAVSDATSRLQNDAGVVGVIGEKTADLSTLLPPGWLSNLLDVKTPTEKADSSSRIATELCQVFDALLQTQPSGVGGRASMSDIKRFYPLTAAAKDGVASERPVTPTFPPPDGNSIDTIMAKPVDFRSLSSAARLGNRVDVNKNRCRQKRERESGILCELSPKLSCHLIATDLRRPTDPSSRNADANHELSSLKQPACNDNVTSTTSTQTNDINGDLQPSTETRKRISRRSRGRGKVRELIKLFESSTVSTMDNGTSPIDDKRATISAAVTVGELLRRASEPEVTSCNQHAPASIDVSVEQPRTASPKPTESPGGVGVDQTPHSFGDECFDKPEAPVAVHRSTARWPTLSRIRGKRARCYVYPTSLSDRAASRYTRRSNVRTTPVNDDREKQSPNDNDNIRETSSGVMPSNEESVKMMNEKNCEYQNELAKSSLNIGKPEIHNCEIATVASTSNLLSPVDVSGLPTVADSISSLSAAAGKETVCQLPSSSSSSTSSSHLPSKLLHTCEVAVITSSFSPSAGGSGDVGGRSGDGRCIFSDGNKHLAAQFDDEVSPSANYTGHGRRTRSPSVSLLRVQSLPTASSERASARTDESTKISSTVTTNDDCRRFNAKSWFSAAGPRFVEVPRWQLASREDVIAIVHRSESGARCLASTMLATETGCPAAYPVLRMTGVTIHPTNKVRPNNKNTRNGNNNVECTVDSFSPTEMRPKSRITKKQFRRYEVQAVKHNSRQTDGKLTTVDEQLFSTSASRRPETSEGDNSAAITTTTGLDQALDAAASVGAAVCGQDQARRLDARKNPAKRGCKPVTSVLSNERHDKTLGSDARTRSVPSDDPTSKQSAPDEHFGGATSPAGTSSMLAKCGLVSSEPILSPCGVTVVCGRRRSMSNRPNVTPPRISCSQSGDRTQQPPATDDCARLAQQFLLTSLLEYRLDAQRK